MERNIELKARLADPASAHQVARELGAILHAVERQMDTYFRVADGRLKLRRRWLVERTGTHDDDAPALRELPTQLIWYRRCDDAEPRPSDYRLATLGPGDELAAVLGEALRAVGEVQKLRTVYLHDRVRIHVDEVKGLGSFLEFEALVDAGCDDQAARRKLEHLRRRFGLRTEQLVCGSYGDLVTNP